jgi:hypothetical protein
MLKNSAEMARFFSDLYQIPKSYGSPGYIGHGAMPGAATMCPGPLPWDRWAGYLNAPYDLNGLSLYPGTQSMLFPVSGKLFQMIKSSTDGRAYLRFSTIGTWSGWEPATTAGTFNLPYDVQNVRINGQVYQMKIIAGGQAYYKRAGDSYWTKLDTGILTKNK